MSIEYLEEIIEHLEEIATKSDIKKLWIAIEVIYSRLDKKC